MHLVSTTNPMSKSEGNVPVSLFCLNGKSTLIRVSEDYEDTVRRVSQALNIPDNAVISLRTSTLDICKGREVVIDESAYPLMWSVLDEIVVVVEQAAETGTQTQTPESKNALQTLPSPAITESSSNVDPLRNLRIPASNVIEDTFQNEEEFDQETNDEPKVTDEEDIYDPPKSKSVLKAVEDKEEPRLQKKFKPAASSTSDAGPSMTNDDAFPPVKKEKMTLAAPPYTHDFQSHDPSPQKSIQSLPAGDDPRFEITITGPGDDIGHFKTRGKHPIRKVLAAACKHFSVDYQRAHLVLLFSYEDDDGGVQTEECVCPLEETMSQCGVDSDSRLFIKLDGEGKDDDPVESD